MSGPGILPEFYGTIHYGSNGTQTPQSLVAGRPPFPSSSSPIPFSSGNHHAVPQWHIIELYTQNLYIVIN